jgi:hypothetical protein
MLQHLRESQELFLEADAQLATGNVVGFPSGPHELDNPLAVLDRLSLVHRKVRDITVASTTPKTVNLIGLPPLSVVRLGGD